MLSLGQWLTKLVLDNPSWANWMFGSMAGRSTSPRSENGKPLSAACSRTMIGARISAGSAWVHMRAAN